MMEVALKWLWCSDDKKRDRHTTALYFICFVARIGLIPNLVTSLYGHENFPHKLIPSRDRRTTLECNSPTAPLVLRTKWANNK